MPPLIRLEHLVKEYSDSEQPVLALDGVDLTIEAGDFVAIMGPSGCGKSTLMHLLGFLLSPSSGKYFLEGKDASSLTDDERADIRNRRIGFVFQSFNLLPRTSVLDNVLLPVEYMPDADRAAARKRALELLKLVKLSHRLNANPNQLSGGEQQRAAIARALINRPALILADEPTGNLDSKTSDEVMDLLSELHHEGHTIVMVTHEEEIAARAHRTIRMKDGRIVSS